MKEASHINLTLMFRRADQRDDPSKDNIEHRRVRSPFRALRPPALSSDVADVTDETRRELESASLIKDCETRELFVDALLSARRLDEALDVWDCADTTRSADVLRRHGDHFLAEGEFTLATDYYSAAGEEIQRERYLRYWLQFLVRTRSPAAIVLYCKRLGIKCPTNRLIALGDGIVAEAGVGDTLSLGHAVRAYEAARAADRLMQLADRCRESLAMTRDQTLCVVDIYRRAGASAQIVNLARTLGDWATLADFEEIFAISGSGPSAADVVAFGRARESRGNFEVALAAYRKAGAVPALRSLANRVIESERGQLGIVDLSRRARAIALEAFHAVAALEQAHRRAA